MMNMKIKRIFFILIFFAAYINAYSQTDTNRVLPGIDVMAENGFDAVSGKRILLLTNHSGRNHEGRLTLDILKNSGKCDLVGILTPEHGFYTTVPAGDHVANDSVNGVPAYSLYGKNRKPERIILNKCDAVVIDVQDIGIRSYTYLSSLYKTMQACAEYGKEVIVLDRPNPLGGLIVDGNTTEPDLKSFVGIIPVSYIHGCTFGELAEMINNEGWLSEKKGRELKCDLKVVEMKNWKRWMVWEDTKLPWFPTSPHIPTVDALRGAAVLGTLGELGVISIGIGTTSPFQYLGRPGFKTDYFEKYLGGKEFSGLTLHDARYQPFYGMYSGKSCSGYLLKFNQDNLFTPYTLGIRIMLALRDLYPDMFSKKNLKDNSVEMFRKVTGSKLLISAISGTTSEIAVMELAKSGFEDYLKIRQKYLIY